MKAKGMVLLLGLSSGLCFCSGTDAGHQHAGILQEGRTSIIDTSGRTLQARFRCPAGYSRVPVKPGSFGEYLRALPLKPQGSPVSYYDQSHKPNYGVYEAVVDLPIGTKNLHQCADAIMRLRAEYLWNQKRYGEIHFNFTNGFRFEYDRWRKGERIRVDGNRVYWVSGGLASDSYAVFWSYMEMVFSYAGTLSLSKELKAVSLDDMQIGDLFIRGGSPGHAVLVADMAADSSGNRIFILAQSYMPAQETQILSNPQDAALLCWYSSDFGIDLITPEWRFTADQLMRFQ